MKKLFLLLLKFFTPLLLVVIFYVYMDPFKVIWHYDSFYEPENTISIPLDKDYVSTATYDNQYKEENYNSFIFGNSRSVLYEIATWKKYLSKDSKPYHFDASAESLYGIYKKIQYIDSKHEKIDNVLLVFDHMVLERDKGRDGHLFAISPQLKGHNNFADFHLQFFRTFLSYKFLPGYIDYKISGKVKPYMTEAVLSTEAFLYDNRINEMRHTTAEKEIAEGTFYTPERMKVFYKREPIQKYSPAVIKKNQKEMLTAIARIFKKHGTKYKIIISPLYNQKKLNTNDLNYLKQLFNDKDIHDFSGINSITNDYKNYYESSHYRPHVAAAILEKVYTK
ncbi:hypothetical protein D3C87_757660 [compost metagenome]